MKFIGNRPSTGRIGSNAASVASLLLVGMLLFGAAADAGAQSPWRLGVALGHGVRTNPLIQSDDVPVAVDLDIAWFGERFYFDNLDAGFTVIDNDAVTVNAVGRINSDRVFFGKTDTELVTIGAAIGQATAFTAGALLAEPTELTVPDRDYAVELGIEVLTDGRWGQLQLAAHHDASRTHDGYEVFLDYGYGWRRQRWSVESSIGFAYKSDELNDYYWGVRPDEANAALPAYQAGSGVNPHLKLAASYQLTRHWAIAVSAEYERLATEAAASPIVADRDVVGYFAGAHYRF
jgi:outer membrane protein